MHIKNSNRKNRKVWGSPLCYLSFLALAGCSKSVNGFQYRYTDSQWKTVRLRPVRLSHGYSGTPDEEWIVIRPDINGIKEATEVAKNNVKRANRLFEIANKFEIAVTDRALYLHKVLTGLYHSAQGGELLDVIEAIAEDVKEIQGFAKFLLESFCWIATELDQTFCKMEESVEAVIASYDPEKASYEPKQLLEAAINISRLQNEEIAKVSSMQSARLKPVEGYLFALKTIEERVANHIMQVADKIANREIDSDTSALLVSHLKALMQYIVKARILVNFFEKTIQKDVISERGNTMRDWLTKGTAMLDQSLQLVEGVVGSTSVKLCDTYETVAPVVVDGTKYVMRKGSTAGSYAAQGIWKAAKWGVPIVGKGAWKAAKWGTPILGKGLLGAAKLLYHGGVCCVRSGYNQWKIQCNARAE